MPVTATSKLSKKPKIIEIDLRSQKLGSPKRYHSQGGSPPQSSAFGTIEPQITTHILNTVHISGRSDTTPSDTISCAGQQNIVKVSSVIPHTTYESFAPVLRHCSAFIVFRWVVEVVGVVGHDLGPGTMVGRTW